MRNLKQWVVTKPETGLVGWLVAIPAGPAIRKGDPSRIVGYVGFAAFVRFRTKAEATRVAKHGNACGIALAWKLAESAECDLLTSQVGACWPAKATAEFVRCGTCHGLGTVPYDLGNAPCTKCDGSGTVS